MSVTLVLTTDTGKRGSYSFPLDAPFGDVIDKFCEDFNLKKEEATFFCRFQILDAEDFVRDAMSKDVFVATEGRFLRVEGYEVLVFEGRVCLGVEYVPQLPSRSELFEIASKFHGASKFTLGTKLGQLPVEKNDTRSLKEEDLFVDYASGYPFNDLVLRPVPTDTKTCISTSAAAVC